MRVRVRMPGSNGGSAKVVGDAPVAGGAPEWAGQAWRTPAEVIERVLRVPTELRELVVGPEEAQHVCGVGRELLDELLDLGLPAKLVDGEPHCDPIDLANIAVHLGLPSLQCQSMTLWRRALETRPVGPPVRYSMEYHPHCDHCGTNPSGTFAFLVPPGEQVVSPADRTYPVEIERPTLWPALPEAAETVWAGLSDIWFFGLPMPLRTDPGFARENRFAGCQMMAHLLIEDSRALDLEVRFCFGLMLITPFCGAHSWNEVRVDGQWVPWDPFLLELLARHVGLDAGQWPPMRSPGVILGPLAQADLEHELVLHDGHYTRAMIGARAWTPTGVQAS